VLKRLKSHQPEKGEGLRSFSLFAFTAALTLVAASACSLTAVRPVQIMADTSAALKAAKEVGADSMTPELYRRANEAYFRARNEYRMKNFDIARDYALRAKKLAEEAEYESLRLGATRSSMTPSEEPTSPNTTAEPYDYPTPTGTPAFILEQGGGNNADGGNPGAPGSGTNPTSTPPPP